MKKTFVLNLLFLIGINLLIKPLYIFGIDRGIQNAVSPAAYGAYFELFNFVFVFQILNDLGIQYFNNRNIAQYPFLLQKYFPYFLGAKAFLAVVYLALIFLSGALAGYVSEWPGLLLSLALVQVSSSLLSYVRSNISGLGWYFADSFLSILDKLILVLLLGVPLWGGFFRGNFPIAWLGHAQWIALLLSLVTGLVMLGKKTGIPRVRMDWRLNALIFKKSLPYAIAVALMAVYNRADVVLMGRLLPDGQALAGHYAAAYRLLDAVNMLGVLFAGLLLPMYAKLGRDKMELGQLAETALRILWSGVLVFVPISLAFGQPIMEGLYEHTTPYSGFLLGCLMLGFIPLSGGYIFSTLLLAKGHQGRLNWVYLAVAGFNVFLNLSVIPRLGASGAAATAAMTQALAFWGVLYGCWKWEQIAVSRTLWYKFFILGLVTGISAWFFRENLFERIGWAAVWPPFVVGVTGIFLLQIITRSDFAAIWGGRSGIRQRFG
ncbi:MAG: lipopolysaccharide biosynthesis protein [Haliscomenobacter sp.]